MLLLWKEFLFHCKHSLYNVQQSMFFYIQVYSLQVDAFYTTSSLISLSWPLSLFIYLSVSVYPFSHYYERLLSHYFFQFTFILCLFSIFLFCDLFMSLYSFTLLLTFYVTIFLSFLHTFKFIHHSIYLLQAFTSSF